MGGKTIEEAQQAISYPEFMSWVAYRNKRGSLHQGLRMDRGFALMTSTLFNINRGKSKPLKIYDLMPYETEPPISQEQAMREWV